LNSIVTPSGHEIGRAQGIQALAAGIEPEVAMNPILLKPTSERASQVVLLGEPWKVMTAAEYHARKPELLGLVLDALADLRRRYDVVVCEGAGSPAEINLLDHDLVNLRVADDAGMAAILVGDINPGGVFAALYGTVSLLPDHLRARVRGLVINKLRGDPALLLDGCEQLAARTGVPVLGVIPWLDVTGLDSEDSMALDRPRHRAGQPVAGDSVAGDALADELDVAVVRFPTISNFTDVDPLMIEPGVRVRFVHDRAGLGDPDLIVLPGTKTTVTDLDWLRARGLAAAITAGSAPVLAICGGYQMLGRTVADPDGIGGPPSRVEGLGLLDVETVLGGDKVLVEVTGRTAAEGVPFKGYEMHVGRTTCSAGPLLAFDSGATDGAVDAGGRVAGCYIHGLLADDRQRRHWLARLGAASSGLDYKAGIDTTLDKLADHLEQHVDCAKLLELARVPEIRDRR
jgi:adenosylcobyric acid synthase